MGTSTTGGPSTHTANNAPTLIVPVATRGGGTTRGSAIPATMKGKAINAHRVDVSIHLFELPYQPTLSTHPINQSHRIHLPYKPTPINPLH